jgi:quinol monooxygenase YgiN
MKARALLAIGSLIGLTLSPVVAEDYKPAFVVSYLEVSPDSVDESGSLLKTYAAAAQQAAGTVQFETFQRIGQSNHFAIIETWVDSKAQETFAASAAAKELRGNIAPLRIGPFDQRAQFTLNVGPTVAAPADAVVAITHIDVVPARKEEGAAAVKTLAEQSRGSPGNIRYDAWVQTSRGNHMTIVESWASMAALTNHTTAVATRTFREILSPMSGGLYDQRLYRVLR